MAGSRGWFIYVTDQGIRYGVELDEDKAGVEGAGFVAVTEADNVTTLPQGTKMRGVNATQTSGTGANFVNTFQPCATQTATLFAGTTKTFSRNGMSYSVSSTRGETARRPKSVNTGQTGASPTVGGGGGGGTT